MASRKQCSEPTPGLALPGKHDLRHATGTDQLVVNHIGSHADYCQATPLLANDFVPGGERDQVRESFEGNGVAARALKFPDCLVRAAK